MIVRERQRERERGGERGRESEGEKVRERGTNLVSHRERGRHR